MHKIYKVEATARYKGTHISEREFELLKYIHQFGVFPAINFHRIFNAGLEKPRTSQAISIRLSKLVKSGILIQLKSEVTPDDEYRLPRYAYRLGARGFDLLVRENYLTEEEATRSKNYSFHLSVPTLHNKAVNTIFTGIVERLIGEGETFESLQITNTRGDRHEEIAVANKKTGYSPIIPDWIYETDDYIICLELDTGTQRNGIIEMKFDRYKRLTKHINKPLIVIFSVGLATKFNIKIPKERRTSSLKELFPEYDKWPDNFDLYVLPTFRTIEVIYKLLKRQTNLGDLYAKGAANNWLNLSSQAAVKELSFDTKRNEELDRLFFNDAFDIDLVSEIISDNKSDPIALIYMEEGSVRSYQKARANLYRISSWNMRRPLHKSKTSLFLVYDTKTSGSNDVFTLDPLCKTFVVNIEEVQNALDSGDDSFPPIIEISGHYKRNERNLI